MPLRCKLVPLVLGAVAEGVVGEDQCGHGFDHWHGSWQDAGVVAAPASEGGVFQVFVDGVLLVHDCGHWLEGDSKMYCCTVTIKLCILLSYWP